MHTAAHPVTSPAVNMHRSSRAGVRIHKTQTCGHCRVWMLSGWRRRGGPTHPRGLGPCLVVVREVGDVEELLVAHDVVHERVALCDRARRGSVVGPRREGLRVPPAGAPGQDGMRLVDQGVVDIAAKNDRAPPLGRRPGVARGRRRGPGVVKGYRRRKMLREEARVLPARSRP